MQILPIIARDSSLALKFENRLVYFQGPIFPYPFPASHTSVLLTFFLAEATSNERDKQAPSLRKQLLRMKMYNRVIAVPSVEDLDNEIYTEALDMFIGAAGGVAEASRQVKLSEMICTVTAFSQHMSTRHLAEEILHAFTCRKISFAAHGVLISLLMLPRERCPSYTHYVNSQDTGLAGTRFRVATCIAPSENASDFSFNRHSQTSSGPLKHRPLPGL